MNTTLVKQLSIYTLKLAVAGTAGVCVGKLVYDKLPGGKKRGQKKKYKDLIVVASEYEKKMDVFIKLINSKAEIREVLAKNGVHFS